LLIFEVFIHLIYTELFQMALVGVVTLQHILLTEVDLSTLGKFQVLLRIKSS